MEEGMDIIETDYLLPWRVFHITAPLARIFHELPAATVYLAVLLSEL
jgi:hypothetical protein